MIHTPTPLARALGLLLAASALPSIAFAQETVAPPTLAAPPAAAPQPEAAPAAAASPGITFAPQAPVVQTAPPPAPPPESVRNPAPEPGATARAQPRRAAAPTQRAAPAPARAAAAAPVVAAAPTAVAPAAVTPAPSPEITPPPAPEAAVAPAPETTTTETTTTETGEVSSGAAWAIMGLVAAVIIGGIAFLIARRRRKTADTTYDEPVYQEEAAYVPVEQPAAAAPMLAPAVVPVAADETVGRPWIDIGLRPIRAEADGDLKVEVTVSNTGDVDAHDVRVSTWMLDSARSSEGEQALIDARSEAQVATVNVATGDDRSVDSVLPMRSEAGSPLLVAEARYPLPQGGEGRIAATFEIEVNGEPENVEARLHDVLERA